MPSKGHMKRTEDIGKILDYLKENGKGTAREISYATGLDIETVVHLLQKYNGWVIKSKREGPSRPKTWRLV